MMNIVDLFENDDDHAENLKNGFWGNVGTGCIFISKDTGRIMLVKRSGDVQEPFTWSGVGGAIDSNENPVEALKREIYEETKFTGDVQIEPLYVFKKPNFKYYNFLVIVDEEFHPDLNWENDNYEWCTLETLPTPLHFGIKALFNDAKSMQTIKKYIEEYSNK